MFQKKVDELLSSIPKAFGIADDILIAGFDEQGTDHDETLYRVLQICRQVSLKLYKDNCHFRGTSIPFFGKAIFQRCKPRSKEISSTLLIYCHQSPKKSYSNVWVY